MNLKFKKAILTALSAILLSAPVASIIPNISVGVKSIISILGNLI